MVLPSLERTPSGRQPGERHQRGVQDRDRTGQYGHQERLRDLAVEPKLHGEVGDKEPEEERPSVAHVDPCRMEVVAEEAHRAAGQANRQPRHQELSVGGGHREDGQRTDRGLTGGQPVHVVQQVEGVRDADHPQDRQGGVQHRLPGDQHSGVHPPQLQGTEHLGGQPDDRRQVPEVVGEANHGQAHGQQEDHNEFVAPTGRRVHDRGGHHRGREGHDDGHPAEVRGRRVVALVATRPVEKADPDGDCHGHRREHQAEDGGRAEDQKVLPPDSRHRPA